MKCTCGREVKDHPAEACLDALFAEKVRRWGRNENKRGRPFIFQVDGDSHWYVSNKFGTWRGWNPSTNIADAMEGVEKTDWINISRRSPNKWICVIRDYGSVYPVGGPSDDIIGIGETAPLAITRALILWAQTKGE